ncbi:hypothetical protein L7F22_069104 [Adiantum nelumboides]|nr:hypothetical protein [Adiantum nelumboides]
MPNCMADAPTSILAAAVAIASNNALAATQKVKSVFIVNSAADKVASATASDATLPASNDPPADGKLTAALNTTKDAAVPQGKKKMRSCSPTSVDEGMIMVPSAAPTTDDLSQIAVGRLFPSDLLRTEDEVAIATFLANLAHDEDEDIDDEVAILTTFLHSLMETITQTIIEKSTTEVATVSMTPSNLFYKYSPAWKYFGNDTLTSCGPLTTKIEEGFFATNYKPYQCPLPWLSISFDPGGYDGKKTPNHELFATLIATFSCLLMEVKQQRELAILQARGKAINLKLQKQQAKLDKAVDERRFLEQVNESMKSNQDSWQLAIKAAEAREGCYQRADDRILELEEQLLYQLVINISSRDFVFPDEGWLQARSPLNLFPKSVTLSAKELFPDEWRPLFSVFTLQPNESLDKSFAACGDAYGKMRDGYQL